VTTNAGGVDAGEYDVVLTLTDASAYTWSGNYAGQEEITLKFKITQAENSWTQEPSVTNGVAGGTAATVEMGSAKFGTVAVAYYNASNVENETPKDGVASSSSLPTTAGSYVAIFTVTGDNNYTGLSKAVEFTVDASALTLDKAPTLASDLTYKAEAQNLATVEVSESTNTGVTFTFAISNLKPGTADATTENFTAGTLPTATDAGTYKVWYKAEKTGTAGIDWTELGDVTIAKASLAGTYTAPSEKADLVYSGSPQKLVEEGTITDQTITGLTIEYSVDGGDYSATVPSGPERQRAAATLSLTRCM
jgi:hypothetical protein